jgi:hypothetical protein
MLRLSEARIQPEIALLLPTLGPLSKRFSFSVAIRVDSP